MKLLLDTHAWFWWTMDSPQLPGFAREAIINPANEVFVSAISVYELVQKYRLGKLPNMRLLAEFVEERLDRQGFSRMPLTTVHSARAGSLPQEHRDPFDRLLMAQSLSEDAPLISNELIFDRFGVTRIWSA